MNHNFKINGLDITIEQTDERVFINLDKNGKQGGYICAKFDDEGIVLDVFNGAGDVVASTWTLYDEIMEGANESE